MRVSILVCTLLSLMPLTARADSVTYRFDWQGEGGYAMRGAVSFDPANGPLITADEVICFAIEGYKDARPIGRWALAGLLPDTHWRLHFDMRRDAFFVEGDGISMPQAWNMAGNGRECGRDGFGFNLGNIAQDLCLDDRLIVESQTDPFKPFPALRDDSYVFPRDACLGPALLSQLR